MDHTLLLIGSGQLLMGSAFFGTSLILALRKKSRMKSWKQTTGVVTDVEISRGMQQSYSTSTPRTTLYKPKIRYQIADGRVIDYVSQTSNSWSNYSVGQQIPVYYDPHQPEKAMFGTNSWLGFIVFGIVGGFLALFGLLFLLIGLASSS